MAKKRKSILTPEDRARQDALIRELREHERRIRAELEERRRARSAGGREAS
jgi:hypothetical protein